MFVSATDENGKNVLDEKQGVKFHVITDDGFTIASFDRFEDAEEFLNDIHRNGESV